MRSTVGCYLQDVQVVIASKQCPMVYIWIQNCALANPLHVMRAILQSTAEGASAEAHHLMFWHGRLARNGDRMAQERAINLFAELGLHYRTTVGLNDMYVASVTPNFNNLHFPPVPRHGWLWHEITANCRAL